MKCTWSVIRLLLALSLCAVQCYGYSVDTEAEFTDGIPPDDEADEEAFEQDDESEIAAASENQDEFKDNKAYFMSSLDWKVGVPKTAFRQPFEYVCPAGSGLSHMYSIHQNAQEDRQWQFRCRRISNVVPSVCTWSVPHAFDLPLKGNCAQGYVVTGIRSLKYSVGHRDRQYSIRCCKMPEVGTCCKESGYINEWDAPLNFEAPMMKIITGISSYHDNYREDRRFKVKYCDIAEDAAVIDCTC